MRILVTGGAGYLGSHVVLRLGELGHEITVLDDLSSGNLWAVLDGKVIEGDICCMEEVREALVSARAEVVVHLAARSDVRESMLDPIGFHRTNTVGTLNVAEASASHGVRHIVFSSSASVYGAPHMVPVTEETPPAPISTYGSSKAMGERILTDVAKSNGMMVAALRFFNVAGADRQGRIGEAGSVSWHLVKVACEAAVGLRDEVVIFGTDHATNDGTCVRDYVHVDDIATAHIAALDWLAGGGNSTAFNVGYGRGVSVREVIAKVKELSGVDFRVVEAERRDGDPPVLVADAERIRRDTGWTPQHDTLDEIIGTALAWERHYASSSRRIGKHDIR